MTTTTLDLKVTADSRAAVSGLKPLQTSLDKVVTDSEQAEHALKDLGDRHKIKIDDDAVDRARKEISRLRDQIRKDLEVDVDADTRDAERRIRQLNSAIRAIDNHEKVEVAVDVDKRGLDGLGRLKTGIGGLSKLAGPVGALTGVLGAVTFGLSGLAIAGIGVTKWALGLADSLAQAKIAFTQFLGSSQAATAFLDNLQSFAAKTPFEFPELVESSKQLLAFGINSKDIIPILTTLGDAAALTGVQVTDLTTIWGQMQAKGKVANEELLQLTEHGIPAYQLLADKMGLTVGQVQDLASKGKLLSGDVLPLLKGQLDATFGGGMAKQARTLSGLWSTLSDTLNSIGTRMGEAISPVVAEQITNLTGRMEEWSQWASENKQVMVVAFSEIAASVLDFASEITTAFQGIIESGAGLLETFASMEGIIKFLSPAARIIFKNTNFGEAADGLHAISDELGGVSKGLKNSSDEAIKTGQSWGQAFARSDAIQAAKNDITDLTTQLATLRKQPPTVRVQANIKDAQAKLATARAELRKLNAQDTLVKIDADIRSAVAKKNQIVAALKNLRGQPQTVKIKAQIADWQAKLKAVNGDLDALRKRKTKTTITANANVKPAARSIDATARKRRTATINVVAPRTGIVARDINTTARGRTAVINVRESGAGSADRAINSAARDRSSTIVVRTVHVQSQASRNDAPSLRSLNTSSLQAAAAALSTAPADPWFSTSAQTEAKARSVAREFSGTVTDKEPTQLRPRQVPVKIYLDGAEIADHLTLKAGRLATTSSVRRRA